jgi:RHS repeat-associated protein
MVAATGATYSYSFDGNGNVSELIDGNGSTAAHYEYGPFGEMLAASGTAAQSSPWRWSTKYQDDETGLTYYGYRFYSAGMGRWVNRDPVEENGGENLYGVVGNQPIDLIDSDGRSEIGPNTNPDATLFMVKVGEKVKGSCGLASSEVQWQINAKVDGYIIQHIKGEAKVTDCTGKAVVSRNPNTEYWESWGVRAGKVYMGNSVIPSYKDRFILQSEGSGTKGTLKITGKVSFKKDYKLPSWGSVEGAGDLPASRTAPPGWDDAVAGSHTLEVVFDCCKCPAEATVTFVP